MERLFFQLKKASPLFLFLSLAATSILLSFLIANVGEIIGYIIILLLFSFGAIVLTISNFRNGFIATLIYSFFFFEIGRFFDLNLPLGTVIEILLLLTCIGVFVQHSKTESTKSPWAVFQNPIGKALLVYIGFAMLQMLNPNSSSIEARMYALRETLLFIMLFFVVMHFFDNLKRVYLFTKVWLFLALLAALYGMYQEYVGVPDYAMRWLMKSPEGFRLAFIWGHLRKWSFLSDISAFGLFMAFSGLVCLILSLGPFKTLNRIILAGSGLIMLISMTFSGTRTATAMVVVGFAFFVALTINNRRTLVFAVVGAMGFLLILFGPFYGGTFSRLRTTFKGSEDASMNVRVMKRLRLQPYARSHPIGGGINTAGNEGKRYEPGHPMAGPYDPDNGYLRMALERGWIGLLINLGLYATAVVYGVSNFFKAQDRRIKSLYAAYLTAFFSISIAHFTQDAMDQRPVIIIIMATYALMTKLIKFDRPNKVEASIV